MDGRLATRDGRNRAGDCVRVGRVTPRLDRADEEPLPVARLLHRLNRPLFAWLHPRNGEVVRAHSIARAAIHHVEPEMLRASPRVWATSSAPSQSRHASSFVASTHFRWCASTDPVEDIFRMNLLPLTPNRCDRSSPRQYARRTVSSWQPTDLATSRAVSSRLGRPVPLLRVVTSELIVDPNGFRIRMQIPHWPPPRIPRRSSIGRQRRRRSAN